MQKTVEKYFFTLRTQNLEGLDRRLEVEIEVRERDGIDYETLEELGNIQTLGIMASMYNRRHFETGGQMYDQFIPQTEAQNHLVEFWKKHHLNDMKAGTKKQMDALKDYPDKHDYRAACYYLKTLDLYEDRGYRYGSGWLCTTFPREEFDQLIQELKAEEEATNKKTKKK
jgi:hypothetical protein